MKKFTKQAVAAVVTIAVLATQTSVVKADTVEQSQDAKQSFEVICDSNGTYGEQTCRVNGEQEMHQEQKVELVGKVAGLYHETVDAGTTKTTMYFIVAVMSMSLIAGAYQLNK